MIYPHIETYIEVISGWRDIVGLANRFWPNGPIIKMTDFDEKFVSSMGEQLSAHKAMTDRQATVAERIIATYEPQLKGKGIDQPDHRNYRLGIRTVNRTSCLTLADNVLQFRFPFDAAMVNSIKEFARTSQGHVYWNSTNLAWEFANTEYNLSWVVAMAQAHNIEVASNCLELFERIVEIEQTPYKIELVYDGEKFSITNAPDSMIDYINNSSGFDDIYSLVDMSGALGYSVSEEIYQPMLNELGDTFMSLCSGHTTGIPVTKGLEEIIEWAIAVNRLPICVYAPNFSKPRLGCLVDYFAEDEIQIIAPSEVVPDPFIVDPRVKVIYTTKVISSWAERLPLLISQVNLMHGTSKKSFVEVAEKLVYHCAQLPR